MFQSKFYVLGPWPSHRIACDQALHLADIVKRSQTRERPIYDLLLPTLFGQVEPIPDELCDLVSLTSAKGDLGKPEAPQ